MLADQTFLTTSETLASLPKDFKEELENPRFSGRKHYNRSTYSAGCRGPLCRMAETHRGRIRWRERALSEQRDYQPIFNARNIEYDLEVMPILQWYLENQQEVKEHYRQQESTEPAKEAI